MEEEKKQITKETMELNCSVCYNLLVEPVLFPCKHYFCLECLESMKDLEGATIKCPMCRRPLPEAFKGKIDKEFQETVKKNQPKAFELRLNFLKVEREKYLKVGFEIGNLYKHFETTLKNKHEWTVYVRLSKGVGNRDLVRYIQEVRFGLDESFYPTSVVVRSPPFELTRLGWGTFPVGIEIKWRKELGKEPSSFSHDLVFSGSDNFKKVNVKFERKAVEQKKAIPKPRMKF